MADLLLGGQIDPTSHERTGQSTTVSSSDLTTHGVIVGMTGSGKTGLGVVLIEDALRAGVPTLIIDPKGDLTNLCLTFPKLLPHDFEPWVNPGDAAKAGQSIADYASGQAAAWTAGLATWGLGTAEITDLRARAEFTIYTPGSTAGVGLNIVGSLEAPEQVADAEVMSDEIEGFVSGLLGLVGIVADPLSSREHILLSNLVLNEWSAGRDLDLAELIGLVQIPPIRKLGVFEIDTFFPPKERTQLALRLNGLLASPSFAAWLEGAPIDIESMLHTPDGKPRCAIVTTAHLNDEERQFATTLVLSKLITWMRRQSGTTDLRVLLYMDEVAGYLPPSAMPPSKKPIMLLMKQARAFGVGVVLSTQNPVDIDYKALSNAGTWMIGRLQTDRDKTRLLDGMSSASGGIDINSISNIIAGLGKREFVLRRAGKDEPEVFGSRWAMSYLRGPLARDQIATLMADQKSTLAEVVKSAAGTASGEVASAPAAAVNSGPDVVKFDPAAPAPAPDDDATSLMPEVADGVPVRWADPAAVWMSTIGANRDGMRYAPAAVARVALRYDDTRSDILHDDEYEAVIFPLTHPADASRAIIVDYDDRDLHVHPPQVRPYALTDAPLRDKKFWSQLERDLIDHLVRTRSLTVASNRDLKLFARPGETDEAFGVRCYQAADAKADQETAKLRDKYEAKVQRIQSQLQTAHDRTQVLATQRDGQREEELLSTAGSILGGLLGGRRSRGGLLGAVLGKAGTAAGRRARTSAAGDRVDAARNKTRSLQQDLEDLESELNAEIFEIDTRWNELSKKLFSTTIPLERTDVKVTQLSLVWVPTSTT